MKNIIKLFSRVALVAFFSAIFASSSLAQTTATINSFSSISGSIDAKITYAAYKGNGTTDPAVSSNNLRIYKPASGKSDGGYIKITAASGYAISSITITNSNDKAGTLKTSVDGGSLSSAITFNKQASHTVNNISASTVDFYNCGSDRLSIAGFSVTYAPTGGSSAVATTTTINASGITNTDISKGTSAGSLSATVKDDQSATISGATVTWSGNNDEVATINANTGAVTLVGTGKVTFTASYAGVDGQYQSSSATYEMTVIDSSNPVSTLTFTAACGGSGTADDGAAWTVTSDGQESTFDPKGIHYGTGKVAVTYIQLSTSDISGTIKQVVVNASTASGVTATVGVTVGGNTFGGDPKSLSTSATDYTFQGSASGQIIVTVTKPSSATGALYVKSIVVTYSSGPVTYSVTYNANGATSGSVPTDATAYESGATVTVLGNTGNLAKAGYIYAGWNLNAGGTGTNYTAGKTFSITDNTTLYAKWDPKTITGLSYTGTPTKTQYSAGEAFDPTGLTVTASFNDESQENVTSQVVWTPNPLTTGTTSVTGTYMEQSINVSGLTVTAAKGSAENPYSVAEARAAIDAGTGLTNVYATGIVSGIVTVYSSQYGNISYNISADGLTTSDQLQAYRGKSFNGDNFTSDDDIKAGDVVVVYGTLKKYNSTYEFDQNNQLVSLKLPAPSFYPEAGAVAKGTTLTISDVHSNAIIYYTTNGTNPTTSSTQYDPSDKPVISTSTTFKAIATKSGEGFIASDAATATYSILAPAATPTFSPAAGTYTWAQNVTISTITEGATIYYTTDGSNPTTSSTEYKSPISVSETMTIKAIAVKSGLANSSVAEATYTMNLPIINAEDVNLAYNATNGSIAYTVSNPASGTLTASITAGNEGDWLTLGAVSGSTVALTSKSNEGDADRTATVTLTYTYNTDKTVTKDVTVTQAHFVVDYAELPFSFDGGSGDIEATTGLTQSGLGDYSSSPRLKFDSTGDYLILKINENPGILSFDIKGNPSNNEWVGSFKLQTSVDGITFVDYKEYTSFGTKGSDTYSESFDDIDSSVRYLKWIFIEKNKGNVALGNIALAKVAPIITITADDPVAVSAGAVSGDLALSYSNFDVSDANDFGVQFYNENDIELNGDNAPNWITVSVVAAEPSGYKVTYSVNANTGEARSAYFKVFAAADNVYSNKVTITQAEYVAPGTSSDFNLFTGNIVEGDYIIYYNGSAMKNEISSNRLYYEEVTPANNIITTGDNSIVWHIAPCGDYWNIYNTTVKAYAASTGANNKAQLLTDGSDDKALWAISHIEDGYNFVNKANSEAGINAFLRNNVNNTNYGFACYAESTGGALTLYKFAGDPTPVSVNCRLFNGRYWATYYNSSNSYKLPDGAKAYTLNSSHQLYLLGDGSVIPANTAVIIIADTENLNLENIPNSGSITPSGDGNILIGSDTDVDANNFQYVLGIKDNVMSFYKFSGTTIPANKAYYVVNN